MMGPVGYQLACAAAIQNMLLADPRPRSWAACSFTLFDKSQLRRILDVTEGENASGTGLHRKTRGTRRKQFPAKTAKEKTIYID